MWTSLLLKTVVRGWGEPPSPRAEHCRLPLCSRAFLEYYQEHLAFACPTEDIYLE